MNKVSSYLLLVFTVIIGGMLFMGAGPAEEGGQIIYFNAADQETSISFAISAIAWVSDQGEARDIDADDDMLLEDGAGNKIFGARAEAATDGKIISFPKPIYVSGLKAEDLDGGVLYIYGTRR